MNPNSDLKNNENVMAANAESSTIKAANAESSTVGAGYAELRISEYAARFAAYSDERLKQTIDHERKVRGWGSERLLIVSITMMFGYFFTDVMSPLEPLLTAAKGEHGYRHR